MKKPIRNAYLVAGMLAVATGGVFFASETMASGENQSGQASHPATKAAPLAPPTPKTAPTNTVDTRDEITEASRIALPVPVVAPASFPYGGETFTSFITTSYKEAGATPPQDFYAWMDAAYIKSGVRFKGKEAYTTLKPLLAALKQQRAQTTDPEGRALLEKQTAGFLHAMIKKSIPKFSLDRGFEFFEAVERGERQCFLQSVLASGMLQAAGMDGGVVMVARNEKGQATNNGHAVALVNLSNGHDALVDISHHKPFIRQQGLMARDSKTGSYRYVEPQYAAQGDQIVAYKAMGNDKTFTPAGISGLNNAFLRSQFDYYRGERAPGGFFAAKKTSDGLVESAQYLEKATREDPSNPLAVYALGRVYLRLNKPAEARKQILTAYRLYDTFGFVPQGPHDALALVKATPQVASAK